MFTTRKRSTIIIFITVWISLSAPTQAGLWNPPLLNESFEAPDTSGGGGWSQIVDDWYKLSWWGSFVESELGGGIPDTPYGDQWGGVSSDAMFQQIGAYEENLPLTVSLLLGHRANNTAGDVTVSLWVGGDPSILNDYDPSGTFHTLTEVGAVQIDSYTLPDPWGVGDPTEGTAVLSAELDTGVGGLVGSPLWFQVESTGKPWLDMVEISETFNDVRIEPVAVLADPNTTSSVRTSLSESIDVFATGDTYYLEIWATDLADPNTGLTSVYVDISFCSEMSAYDQNHGNIFTTLASGTIQSGGVDEFGGSALPSGGGNEPEWVRVGWMTMSVDSNVSECTITLAPSTSGVGALDRGLIPWGEIILGSLTLTRDCNGNGVPDPNDIIDGTSLDCNENGIPDECDIAEGASQDCNGNGIPDECDIADETSQDCNGNGIPDECDIADETSQDCNGNGIPDECDIAGGFSTDVNFDGIPDDCQLDIRIEPVVVLIDPASTSEVRSALPVSLTAVVRSSNYYVEIWASDLGDINSGLSGVFVDLSFCGETTALVLDHGSTFTTNPSGTIISQGVDEFGGATLSSNVGVEPEWVRIGWITMRADVDIPICTIALVPSSLGVTVMNRGLIPWEFIELGSLDLEITLPGRWYDLDDTGFIDAGDLGLFAGSWLESVPPGAEAHDFDCDYFVGVGDFSWFATGWLKFTDNPTILYAPCGGGGSSPMVAGNQYFMESEPHQSSVSTASVDTLSDVDFELVVLDTPSPSDTTEVLPASLYKISNGQTYYLEIWVSDVGDINTGITSAYVDVGFSAESATVINITNNIFTDLATGNIVSGGIDELGGSTPIEGTGVEPQWVRVAVVEMRADAAAPPVVEFTLSPSSTGVGVFGRGQVAWEDISLDSVSVPPLINICDLNKDYKVDIKDFSILTNWWYIICTTGNNFCDGADFNPNGQIGIDDLFVFVQNWLQIQYVRFYNEPLDSDPVWSTQGQWAFGQPAGLGGTENGNPDPNSGHTGINVYGVNLNGDYDVVAGGPYYLTTGPIDCSGYHNIHLNFARWLNTDYLPYIDNIIELSINGSTWSTIWQHTDSSALTDDSWQIIDLDISSIADREENVYIRWSYYILDDRAYQYSGWNIDDLELWGEP